MTLFRQLLALGVTLSLLCPSASARTVRVSFYEYPGCHLRTADGKTSGYGYDFMEMLAAEAGWKVEYTAYERPWGDMLPMLERGELDVVDFVGWQADRAERMLYSKRPMAYSGCSIRTVPEKAGRFSVSGIHGWGHVRVGVLEGDQNEEGFRDFAEDHAVDYEIVRFPTEEGAAAALKRGELDLVAFDGFAVSEGLRNIETFDPARNHLVTRKSDAALMAEIDAAMAALDRKRPGWMAELRQKYYPVSKVVAWMPVEKEIGAAMEGYLRTILARLDEILGAKIEIRRCRRDFSDADFSVPSFAAGVFFTPENVGRFAMPQHSIGRLRADLLTTNGSVWATRPLAGGDRPLRIGYLLDERDFFRPVLERYALEHAVSFVPDAASTRAELRRGLEKGRFDLVLRPSGSEPDLATVAKCGYAEFFLAPAPTQTALLHSLSEALKYLRMDEPDLIYDLETRFFADENDVSRLVRLGAYVEPGLSVRRPDGTFSGFVSELSEIVARRAGWNLKPVALTYPEAQRALAAGEIDLMGASVWTPERAKVYDYSKFDVGPLYYALMKRRDGRMLENRPDTWKNARIGVMRGSLSLRDLERFLAERGVEWQPVPFNRLQDAETQLREGRLDAVYALANNDNRDLQSLAMLPTTLCYFCSNKRKPWVKADFDAAIDGLLRENHRFIVDLYEKHLSSTRGVLLLEPDEIAFVSSRRGRRTRISFCRERPPLVTVHPRSGRIEGFYRRIFDRFSERTGLELEYAIGDQSADLMLSVDGDHRGHERDIRSEGWLKSPACWVKRRTPVPSAMGVVAVVKGGGSEELLRRDGYRPLYLADREACYAAVVDGRAEQTIDSLSVARYLIDEREGFKALNYQAIDPAVFTLPVTLYSHPSADPRLRNVLTKAKDSISAEEYDTMLFESVYGSRSSSVNLKLLFGSVALVLLVAGLLMLMAVYHVRVARAANRAKSAFLSNMSHDIRTPMNAILGFSDIAIRSADDPVKVKDCLRKVRLSGVNLLEIIDDILDMTKIESGKVEITEYPANVSKMHEYFQTLLSARLRERGHVFVFNTENVRDDAFWADKPHMNRVFLNLLTNAVKYSPKGGRIAMTVTQLPDRREGRVTFRFTIEDNGIGMSPEFRKRIFERFTRERNSTVSGIQGTGIGLSITKALVDRMGGTIEVDSKEGVGTKFILTFDFRRRQPGEGEDEPAQAAQTPRTAPRRVLLVEDNEINREIATEILKEQGFEVETAVNGKDAVEKVVGVKSWSGSADEKFHSPTPTQNSNYDLILMDIQMPVMNGYEATRAIRAAGIDLPIVALSANAFAEDKEASLAAGMNDHVAKPIKVKELMAVLDRFPGAGQ